MNNEKELKPEELDQVSGGWRSDFYMDVQTGAWYNGPQRVIHVKSHSGGLIWSGDYYKKLDNATITLWEADATLYLSDFDYFSATEMVDPSIFTIV